MCRLETEGTKYGCGHYITHTIVAKQDCMSQFCTKSSRHAKKCPHCPRCEQYYGPDVKETITHRTDQYCHSCEYWYRGAGSRPHPPTDGR